MNKLEMAHQYFMQTMGFIRNNNIDHNFDDVVSESWDYVDAMQTEADKREEQNAVDECSSPEWQPDWSQAPDWANWYAVGSLSKKGLWSVTEPEHINIQGVDYWDVTSPHGEERKCYSALTSYTGDWRNSVRKRP